MKTGHNIKTIYITNPSDNNEGYDVEVSYNWSTYEGCNFLMNGDYGYPPESWIGVVYFKLTNGEDNPAWLTDELVDKELSKQPDLFVNDKDI